MNKKIVIPIIVIILLGVAGGIFWWQWGKYQKEKEFEKITVGEFFKFRELPKGFVINETSEGVVLENKEIGISFKVPEDWDLVGYMEDFIDLISPDYEADPETFSRVRGCIITVETSYYTIPNTYLSNRIDNIKKGVIHLQNEEIIQIGGKDALKIVESNEWLLKQGIKETIEVNIPFPKAEIKFLTKIFKVEESKCIQEFNDFLKTLSID